MKKFILSIILLCCLVGCSTAPERVYPSAYLTVISENGRPDSIFEDYLNWKVIIMYDTTAYVFTQDYKRLIDIKEVAAVVFIHKVELKKKMKDSVEFEPKFIFKY